MMNRLIDRELKDLKEKILVMGHCVEQSIDESIQALLNSRKEDFKKVHDYEVRVNQSHIEVDELCLKVLATQSPIASDLRLILAIIKINTDLERMGDQAVNIAYQGTKYLEAPPLKPLVDLPKMAEETRKMVKDSLDAFVRSDVELAKKVLSHDDIVDSYKDKIVKDLIQLSQQNAGAIERALELILIARNLERIADHATNIAEDVIFVATGNDIRHGSSLK